jgi:release factor glutamine methyltransferase
MSPLHERLADARDRLVRAGVSSDEASLDAEVLARHVLNCDRATLLTRARDPLPSAFGRLYDELVQRRAAREPIAYIVGHREFWGLEFEVTPDVLIPRPETELIIEEALSVFPHRHLVHHIIDIGTGSGCLAVILAIEFASAGVVATDTSDSALEIAERNAGRHNVSDRIAFVRGDLLGGAGKSAELILSNPPYVPEADAATLQPEVARYEPSSALYAGPDGLAVIRRLLEEAPPHLAPEGRLIVEFGFGQEPGVREAARQSGWTTERVRRDLQGIPRVAVLRR